MGEVLQWRSSDGARYAILSSPEGSIVWMCAFVPLIAEAFNVRFSARLLQGQEGCVPVVYAGRLDPCYPAFFHADHHDIGSRWKEHSLTVEAGLIQGFGFPPAGGLVVAIGFADPWRDRAEVTPGQQVGIANVQLSQA
jgi:hypothetical protein